MLGHVTSSYRSAALGRTFALALCAAAASGSARPSTRDGELAAEVVDPVLYDREGTRRDGRPD